MELSFRFRCFHVVPEGDLVAAPFERSIESKRQKLRTALRQRMDWFNWCSQTIVRTVPPCIGLSGSQPF